MTVFFGESGDATRGSFALLTMRARHGQQLLHVARGWNHEKRWLRTAAQVGNGGFCFDCGKGPPASEAAIDIDLDHAELGIAPLGIRVRRVVTLGQSNDPPWWRRSDRS